MVDRVVKNIKTSTFYAYEMIHKQYFFQKKCSFKSLVINALENIGRVVTGVVL